MNIQVASGSLWALHDDDLRGFLTWTEKGINAVLMFTTGDKAEEYFRHVFPARPISVYRVHKTRMQNFVHSMLNSKIEYAIIDLPWQHADWLNVHDDEVVRNYAIIDLRLVKAKFTR